MKKFLAAALAAVLAVSMTACSGDTSSDVSDAVSASDVTSGDTSVDDTSADTSADTDTDTGADTDTDEEIEEVAYVLGGEITPTMIANSRYNEGNQVRLAGVIKKLQAGEEVTVAYLGGSITQGTSAGDDLCYARLTTNWLEEQFPDATVNYVNAGIGATGSYIGVHRADEQVLAYEPDLVFIDFSVNDTSDRMTINNAAYESLLRKLWFADSSPAIVTIAMTQDNGTSVQESHGEIARRYDIPMISYKNAILDVINKGYIAWTDISDDNIHPNVAGHQVLTDLITSYLQSVIDNLDSITGEESDLSNIAENGDKYVNAKLLMSSDTTPVSTGGFAIKTGAFGGFNDPWMIRSTEGEFSEEDALVFEVEAKNIGILYGMLTSNAGKAEVYIDDVLYTTIDADFTGGWGSYVEFAEIASFDETSTHTVRIVPVSTGSAAAFYVSALAVS